MNRNSSVTLSEHHCLITFARCDISFLSAGYLSTTKSLKCFKHYRFFCWLQTREKVCDPLRPRPPLITAIKPFMPRHVSKKRITDAFDGSVAVTPLYLLLQRNKRYLAEESRTKTERLLAEVFVSKKTLDWCLSTINLHILKTHISFILKPNSITRSNLVIYSLFVFFYTI